MNAKPWIAAALALAMSGSLIGCGGQGAPEQTQTQEEQAQNVTVQTPAETTASSAADYAKAVSNANIDAAIYLDYAAGIEAGVYKWVLSEDGDYYALAAVDESGEPIEQQESAINVGANNAERSGMGGFGGGMPGGGQMPEGGFPGGGMGGKGGMGGGMPHGDSIYFLKPT